LKIRIVEKDPLELHERKWLNFGHTIGHGIELANGHSLLHGECVAIGMVKLL
jgi:3-dehydroquinate synthase